MRKKIDPEKIKLRPYERRLEEDDQWQPVPKAEFQRIKKALDEYKKDKVLNIRVNGIVLEKIKKKAKKMGVKYQTFIAEILRTVADS